MSYPVPDIWLPMRTEDYDPDNDTGDEQIVDYDMADEGDPTLIWTEIGFATISKVSNGEGGQALRIELDEFGAPGAQQIVLSQNTNIIHCRARGDGVEAYPSMDTNGVTLWTGTASNEWQEFTLNQDTDGTAFAIRAHTPAGGGYTEFDFASAKKFNGRTLDISGSNHGYFSDRDEITRFPKQLHDKGLEFSGGVTYVTIPTPLTESTPFTVSHLVKNPVTALTVDMSGVRDATDLFYDLILSADTDILFYVGGLNALNAARALDYGHNSGQLMHLVGVYDGTDTFLYIDGHLAATAITPIAPSFNNQDIEISRRYSGGANWKGEMFDAKWWIGIGLNVEQVGLLYQDDMREYARLHI